MGVIDELKARIRATIKTNGNRDITGNVLQGTLLDMVDVLDEDANGNVSENADVDVVGNILVDDGTACKITQNTYNSKSSNDVSFIKKNTAFDAYYLADSGITIYGVVVTMGGTDISSTAVKDFNPSAAHVNIASVTGAVVIDVKATKPIVFEDSTVKELCVTNWGGGIISGEITEYEASKVTTLNNVFKNNTTSS